MEHPREYPQELNLNANQFMELRRSLELEFGAPDFESNHRATVLAAGLMRAYEALAWVTAELMTTMAQHRELTQPREQRGG
jgi:hypothetical protein